MNWVGTRFGWGSDGGGDDEKPNKDRNCCIARPKKKERGRERQRESQLPFYMSA